MKYYSNINNSGYNWSSVPLKKMFIADEMIKKIHKPRIKKNKNKWPARGKLYTYLHYIG